MINYVLECLQGNVIGSIITMLFLCVTKKVSGTDATTVKCLEMFEMNIKSFCELLRLFVHVLRRKKLYLGTLCWQAFAIVHAVFIRNYGLGREHYCVFICDYKYVCSKKWLK